MMDKIEDFQNNHKEGDFLYAAIRAAHEKCSKYYELTEADSPLNEIYSVAICMF